MFKNKTFYINDIEIVVTNKPEELAPNLQVFWEGNYIVVAFYFGLSVKWWPEKGTAFVFLCKSYINYICGLCGHGAYFPGNINVPNGYVVNRSNNTITGSSDMDRMRKFEEAWRVPDDTPNAPPEY